MCSMLEIRFRDVVTEMPRPRNDMMHSPLVITHIEHYLPPVPLLFSLLRPLERLPHTQSMTTWKQGSSPQRGPRLGSFSQSMLLLRCSVRSWLVCSLFCLYPSPPPPPSLSQIQMYMYNAAMGTCLVQSWLRKLESADLAALSAFALLFLLFAWPGSSRGVRAANQYPLCCAGREVSLYSGS